MAITYEVIDGQLAKTETKDSVVSLMTKAEIEGKKREIQTQIDHLDIDRATHVADLKDLDDQIALLEK